MSVFAAQLYPGRALGFLVLGASLHDIITRLKAEPQRFPKLELVYSPHDPVREPVVLTLPGNGVRLRFDGQEQRLRLIEVVDFTRNHITFQDRDVVKPAFTAQGIPTSPIPGESGAGPTFRHIYNRLFGPTYGGEFIPPEKDDGGAGGKKAAAAAIGTYVLSYPGVAFSFPLSEASYSPNKDVVSLLSSSSPSGAGQVATSMAIFAGDSWAHARETLWTEVLPSIKTFAPFVATKTHGGGGGGSGGGGGGGTGISSKDVSPDEISLVRIHGGGRLQLMRKWTPASTWLTLGETTPQELVAELGPPDAIYRKNDQRMYIHKMRTASNSRTRRPANLGGVGGETEVGSLPKRGGAGVLGNDDGTDTDQSSAHTGSDDHDSDDEAVEDDAYGPDAAPLSGECFYNYFYLGFDVLVSPPVPPSRLPPSVSAGSAQYAVNDGAGRRGGSPSPSHSPSPAAAAPVQQGGYAGGIVAEKPVRAVPSPDRLVATKLVLHGNVPGSYPFNRHRRCRWEIAYLQQLQQQQQQQQQQSQQQRQMSSQPPGASPHQQYGQQFQDLHLPPQHGGRQQYQQQPPSQAHHHQRSPANSETPFDELEPRLRDEWAPVLFSYTSPGANGGGPNSNNQRQRGMVLNRGWGDSPGSSCEFLGGWEDSAAGTMSGIAGGGGADGGKRTLPTGKRFDGSEDSTTTLYGFPGLVFEVLRNGFVSAVTVI